MATPPVKHHRGMELVALWTCVKATAVFLIGVGFALLVAKGESAYDMAKWLVDHLHANPQGRAVAWFLDWSEHVELGGWFVFFGAIAAYSILHWIQAWGLWREYRWAEWLAALSGSIYLPLEAWEMIRHPGWVVMLLMLVNASVVAYMAWMLWTGRRKK